MPPNVAALTGDPVTVTVYRLPMNERESAALVERLENLRARVAETCAEAARLREEALFIRRYWPLR